MVSQASLTVLLQMNVNSGDLIMLGAVVFWSLYTVELHRGKHLPSPDVLLFLIAVTGVLMTLPLYMIEHAYFETFVPSAAGVAAVFYLGMGSTVLAVYLWNASIRSVGANRAAVFLNLIPVFGAVLAIVFLRERIFGYHLIGAFLVVIGIFLAVRRVGEQPAEALATEKEA